MMRGGVTAVLIVLGTCAGCATNPLSALPKRTPVDIAELQRKADAVLDYVAGTLESLPADLFAVTPLEDTDKDPAAELQDLADEMRAHYPELSKLRARRVLGEDNRGYLSIRSEESFTGADDKNLVQQAMSAENDSRKASYRLIAQASEERGLTLTRVERAFAARRLARSLAGALVQLPSNDPEFEAFRESAAGKQIDAAAHPGEWVAIP